MMARKVRLLVLVALLVTVCQSSVFAAQWYTLLVDKGNHPPQPVMDEVWKSIRVTGELFTRYKLILPEIVTIRVATTQDSYARALMHYFSASPAEAAQYAKLSAGMSSTTRPVVILNGHYADGFASTLPHELFHQAQRQLATTSTPTWITEGSAELFEKLALHQAGKGVFVQYIQGVKNGYNTKCSGRKRHDSKCN